MQTPEDTLDSAVDRASEITWWNRNLTKLTRFPEISNAEEFLREELIERKGPYIEMVDAPAQAAEPATSFLQRHDYAPDVIDALVTELFGGDDDARLYQHQAEMIDATEANTSSNIITVPTATGKTESFLLPILNACLQEDEEGTKAIIVYPMKTLAVDQLNRVLRYLDLINRARDPEDRITVGIWDGDTPNQVGARDGEIEPGSYVRGLECPRTDRKLTINDDGHVVAEGRTYPWVKVTKDHVREGADILLTNPEAMDHAFVNDSADTRGVFGDGIGDHPVKHIVFDEAHVWRGVKGAAVRFLIDRLTHFYEPSDPQVSLVSATVKNPAELAESLTGESREELNVVSFSGRQLESPGDYDFNRLEPTTLEEICETLARSRVSQQTAEEFLTGNPCLQGALETGREVGLLSDSAELQLADDQPWLGPLVDDALEAACTQTTYSTPEELVAHADGRRRFQEVILDEAGIDSSWHDFVLAEIPEVLVLADWFDSETMGNVEFKHLDDILDELDPEVTGEPAGYLQTVMGFGRLAGVVTEKHHSFLKPPLKVFWCAECGLVSRREVCSDCARQIPELQFCETCNHPFVIQGGGLDEQADSEEETDENEGTPVPLDGVAPSSRCPSCRERIHTTDAEVPTTTLLSFMLSELCRETPSEKVLVFSDSHSSAENVAKQIQQTEYGLMAASLYVNYLMENGGTGDLRNSYHYVVKELRREYWNPFYDDSLSPSGSAYNMVEQLQDDVVKNADLYNCGFLFDSALVTSGVLYEAADDAFELAVGQTLWEVFASSATVGFTKSKVDISALSREKIHGKVQNKLSHCNRDITDLLDSFIAEFYQAGLIHEADYEELQFEVESNANSEEDKRSAMRYINQQRETLAEVPAFADSTPLDSGLFVRKHKQVRCDLQLLTHAAFCQNCYSAFPALPDDAPSEVCFNCGSQLTVYERFQIDESHNFDGDGYADVDEETPWALDHWAHDIMRPLGGDELDFVTIGIHKGNIPATVRGIVEEGFRKDDPDINIVSSTPTMELGVDIGTLDTVAQVGMPPTLTNYVQRSGRTGRSRGSSSLVVTTIRGRHPVDNHFYQDLSRFFSEFQPVRVPPAYEFEQLLAGHVVTEVMAHMARNPHQSNIFERAYRVSDEDLSPDTFVGNIRAQLGELTNVITGDREHVLKEYIHDIFGEDGVRVFEDVFEGSGTISLKHRFEETFDPLSEAGDDVVSTEDLVKESGRLDNWLGQLGYLANYRTFGHRFPVSFSGYERSISFESTGRLYDMFPGEENDLGAVFSMGGRDYLVDDVQAGRELTRLRVCTNDECDWPFQSYSADLAFCPHCDDALTQTAIHEVGSVHCRPAYKGQKFWNTRGLHTTDVELTPNPDTEQEETTLFGLSARVTNGSFKVTEFIYAFERRHSSSSDVDVLRSEAETSGAGSEYAPVGRQFQATGLKFDFSKQDLAAQLDETVEEVPWAVLMISLEQALKRAVAVSVKVELDDFQVQSSLDDETLSLAIVDGRSGGNGISWEVSETLHSTVLPTLQEIVTCDNCHQYCEECLLLPRTPAFYLENDLLEKPMLQRLMGSDESSQSIGEEGFS